MVLGAAENIFLRDEPNCISVYICSPMEKERVERITRLYNLSPEGCTEKKLCRLIKSVTAIMVIMPVKTGEPAQAIIFPSIQGTLGIDNAVELIKKYIELKRK